MKQMPTHNLQFHQRTEATIQSLQTQIGQLANAINQNQSPAASSSTLPSQTVPNPNSHGKNVSAITLRSRKQVDPPERLAIKAPPPTDETCPSDTSEPTPPPTVPFPHRLSQSKKLAELPLEKEILDTFRKVEVNIPLQDAIRQIPKYTKFFEGIVHKKRRLAGHERVSLSKNVSALIQPMPPKCKDPGTFSVPCIIGNCKFDDCMLDLGVSINVMSTSVFKSLGLGPLKATSVVIQLANRSNAHPAGLVEDVSVKVNELIFPTDFYILEMEGELGCSRSPIILGRPFLKTARTKIDVHSGTMSMEFGDNIVKFNIFDAMRQPRDDHFVLRIDVIDDVIEKYLESMHETCIANDLSCGIDLKLSDASVLSCDCDTHS